MAAFAGEASAVAVAAMTSVTFFTDRVRAAVSQQASEALAADLRIDTGSELPPALREAAVRHGFETANVVSLRSVVVAGETTSLAVTSNVTREGFEQAVVAARDYIHAGDAMQVVLHRVRDMGRAGYRIEGYYQWS